MPVFATTRAVAMLAAFAWTVGALAAQTSLPATSPTSVTPSQLPSANPGLPRGTAATAFGRSGGPARIQWDGRLIEVDASGQGLNGVLQAVARTSGIRLTGSVQDEPVFGKYGPAPLPDVLAQLVDGLSINMLFVDRAGTRPAELTLTSQNGGATPPGLAREPQPVREQAEMPASPSGFAPPVQLPGREGQTTHGNVGEPGDAQNGAPPESGTEADTAAPNGVKTPQEVFEQLQRLRSLQRQQQQADQQ